VAALAWSGGKDSALALHELRERSGAAPRALITTVTADYGRISMHGVRRELLCHQAGAVGLPPVEVEIPAACSNDVHEQRLGQALAEVAARRGANDPVRRPVSRRCAGVSKGAAEPGW
jgi:diphthamide synthase (EF-2-diphthine--ammonia ligase)